jgi:hypothetical protein
MMIRAKLRRSRRGRNTARSWNRCWSSIIKRVAVHRTCSME